MKLEITKWPTAVYGYDDGEQLGETIDISYIEIKNLTQICEEFLGKLKTYNDFCRARKEGTK